MKLWALDFHLTDEYTYDCDVFLGVFLTEADALAAAIKHFETAERPNSLDDYRAFEIEVGALRT